MRDLLKTLDKTKKAEAQIYSVYSKFWEIKNHLDFLGIETESTINKLREEVYSYEPFILTHWR